jgi:hypothetical protein
MTSDKFVISSGVIPPLSWSSQWPADSCHRFQVQARRVSGPALRRGGTVGRQPPAPAQRVTILSISAWCLKNALETADSMKSRATSAGGPPFPSMSDDDRPAALGGGGPGRYIFPCGGGAVPAATFHFRLAPRMLEPSGCWRSRLLCLTRHHNRRGGSQWTRLRSCRLILPWASGPRP